MCANLTDLPLRSVFRAIETKEWHGGFQVFLLTRALGFHWTSHAILFIRSLSAISLPQKWRSTLLMQEREQVQRGEWYTYLPLSYMLYFLLSQVILSIVKCDSFNIGMDTK